MADKFQALKEYEYIGKDYDFTENWFVPGRSQWKNLAAEFEDKPINVLEVGVFEGRATVWILENLFNNPKSQLFAIDTFEGAIEMHIIGGVQLDNLETRFHGNVEKTGKGSQVTVMKGYSYDNLVILNNNQTNNVKFDLIYIDGSHNADDVLADAVLAWRLLKENGIMIFDDFELVDRFKEPYNNPRLAIDSFVACHQFEIQVLHQNYQLAIRKIPKGNERKYTMVKEMPDEEIFYKI